MRTQLRNFVPTNNQTARTVVHLPEQPFGSILADVTRLLWPSKTAAHLAAAAGCSERGAEMYLAGDREWSAAALGAVVMEILKRQSMRNVKIVAR